METSSKNTDPQTKKTYGTPISFGEPVQIFATRMDEECGVCGAIKGDSVTTESGRVIHGGLDLSDDKMYCLCNHCGFAF